MATQLVLQGRILITLAILLQTIGIVMGTHKVHLKQPQIILAIEILSSAVTIAIQLSGRGNRFPLENNQNAFFSYICPSLQSVNVRAQYSQHRRARNRTQTSSLFRHGKIDSRATTISLAKTLAACFAGLTHGLPEEDAKFLLHELYEMIEGDVAYHQKDLKENFVSNK